MNGSQVKLKIALFAILVITILMILSAGTVSAQSGGGYDLTWWTVDSGGVALSGGSYTLAGSAGQPDSSMAPTGGAYQLTGGFWSDAAAYKVYLPSILR